LLPVAGMQSVVAAVLVVTVAAVVAAVAGVATFAIYSGGAVATTVFSSCPDPTGCHHGRCRSGLFRPRLFSASKGVLLYLDPNDQKIIFFIMHEKSPVTTS